MAITINHDQKTRLESACTKWSLARTVLKNRSATMVHLFSEAVREEVMNHNFEEALDFLKLEMPQSPEKVILLAEITKMKLAMDGVE